MSALKQLIHEALARDTGNYDKSCERDLEAASELAALEQRVATLTEFLTMARMWNNILEFSRNFSDGEYWKDGVDAALQERKP